MLNNVYNILLTVNKNHFKLSLVTMLSAMLNCQKECHFFIMQSDWSARLKSAANEFVEKYSGNTIEFIDVDDKIFYKFKPFKDCYTVYYKLLAHKYLPVDKVLYLDADVIIRKDIYGLYSTEFDDNYYIAINSSAELRPKVKNYDWFKIDKMSRHLRKSTNSNPGVLFINLKKFRTENIDLQFWENSLLEMPDDNYWVDEGIINFTFWEKRKFVPAYKYETMIRYTNCHKEIFALSKEERKEFNEDYWDDFDEKEALTIIHFVVPRTAGKPWLCFWDKKEDKIIDLHGRRADINEEPYYKEWWKLAEMLPMEYYEEFLKEAFENVVAKPIRNSLKYSNNELSFFKSLAYDCTSDLRFINYIQKLSGLKISILKSSDSPAIYLNKIADLSSIQVVFSTNKHLLSLLTDEEWDICKQADIIINCSVHGAKPDERDGIKPIMIGDILKDDSMLPKESNYSLVLSNNKLHDELEYTRHELQKQITLLSDKLTEINKITGEKDKLANENKVLREEKARLNTETVVLNNKLENSVKEYELLKDDSENKIKSLMLENERFSDESANKINELNKQITQYENSRSWKVTKPFRSILWFFIKRFNKASLS